MPCQMRTRETQLQTSRAFIFSCGSLFHDTNTKRMKPDNEGKRGGNDSWKGFAHASLVGVAVCMNSVVSLHENSPGSCRGFLRHEELRYVRDFEHDIKCGQWSPCPGDDCSSIFAQNMHIFLRYRASVLVKFRRPVENSYMYEDRGSQVAFAHLKFGYRSW